MSKLERKLHKVEHPFGIDGYWWFWTDASGNRWSLKTILWVGFKDKRFEIPRQTEEDVVQRGNCKSFVHPYSRYFYHPIKKQALMLTNITKRNAWLREQRPDGKI